MRELKAFQWRETSVTSPALAVDNAAEAVVLHFGQKVGMFGKFVHRHRRGRSDSGEHGPSIVFHSGGCQGAQGPIARYREFTRGAMLPLVVPFSPARPRNWASSSWKRGLDGTAG